jgi:DNA-binding transcriptional MerR regulator
VSTYTIGELAERSGFTASALRYYEGIGLVAPAARTDAGYRLYNDGTLARLAFIDRAKRLGCSLEEITDLVAIWDGDRCEPVQRRFHELVTSKIADSQRQISELTAFTAQLQQAATQLSGPPVDGSCGDGCACVTALPSKPAKDRAVAFTPKPDGDTTIACTLETREMPGRLADWQAVLDLARLRTTTSDGARRVEFDDDIDLGRLTQLVVAERHCCAFFSFAITIDGRGIALEVHAPDGAGDIVTSLVG